MNGKLTKGDRIFQTFNYALLSGFTFICLFPFLNTFANAFSGDHAIQTGEVVLYPVDFQLKAMSYVIHDPAILRAFAVTVFVTAVGTAMNLLFSIMMAYPLSRKDLRGRALIMNYVIVTMVFSGGMIPTFLVVKNLGLVNSLLAIIVPTLISSFNMIVLKTFFQEMPEEIREAALIDGCGNVRYMVRILLPLSGAAMATIGLFYAVTHWNSYFGPLLYLDKPHLHTLQVKLRSILLLSQMNNMAEVGIVDNNPLAEIQESLKGATIVFATLPILAVYPWLQKYFVKGALIGSVKG